MKKISGLKGRLPAYAASAAAFLAGGSEAQAFIVYNDIDPDLIAGIGDTIEIDLDGDGSNDIRFWIESMNGVITSASGGVFNYSYRFAYASGLDNTIILGQEATFSGYSFQSAYNFMSGDTIGYGSPGFFNKARLAAQVSIDGIPFYSGGPWSGLAGYMGIRFNIGDDVHYAWLRLDVATGASEIKVSEYAWDNQVGVGITAGLTAPIASIDESDGPAIWAADNMLHIVQSSEGAELHVELYAINGAQIWSKALSGADLHQSTFGLAPGIYFIIARSGLKSWKQKIYIP